ncbi:integrin beta [Elysia marginata]|uniref:Integrin beta n=1 Tax=Elysia marginata TaxID=1093978 RepID=A0AAV4K1N5_9GAST|nr:integrin beta [Elysia marginata]
MATKLLLGLAALLLVLTGESLACSGSTCSECITSDPSCSWCAKKDFSAPRCQNYFSLINAGCQSDEIQTISSSITKTVNDDVRDSKGKNRAIQVQPQLVQISTGIRRKETFTMTFRAADNYPVDLYFLFDSSLSMRKHIASLANLTDDIGRSIGDISSNYRMAYGTFQDKVALPFTGISPLRKANPCVLSSQDIVCSPPYEYKHLLNMTHEVLEFQTIVRDTKLTGNIDIPEGSIDAILQAVACEEHIGWRPESRKLLIFATDERFHIAGDGKLAGIVFPNDMKCHLNSAGDYVMELQQDYPSISQLTEVVDKHEVHIIFTVTDNQRPLYSELSLRVPQSTVELLADEGTGNKNIKEIIEKKYKEMISEVTMRHSDVEGVDIKIKAKSDSCERKDTNVCKGIKIGQRVDFEVEVLVTSCPPEGNIKRTVEIYPGSLSKDKMILEIETHCECKCALDENTWDKNSDVCNNGNGTLKCGQCDCNAGRFGQTCECDITDTGTDTSGCIPKGSNSTDAECSGAGTCVCGVCQCDEDFSGPYCECNDKSCGTFQRQLCGGVRGRCRCGQCVCEPEYSGPTCGCSTLNTTCLSLDGKLCSDQGTCECGECRCNEGYVGLYCENCVLCGDTVCDIPDYRDCAECLLRQKDPNGAGDFKDILDCSSLDCPERKLVKQFEENEESSVCSVKLSDGCFMNYRISTKDSDVLIEVFDKKQCPEPLNVIPVVVGVIIGVVLLGLFILLLWKVITYFVDKREYSRFQEDIAKGKWAQNDNPMYKGATTTYRNPMLDPDNL